MPSLAKKSIPPPLVIFSSIRNIASSLREAASPSLNLEVIEDPALGGYGGTVEFDASRLTKATCDALAQARILVSEPSVLAQILKVNPEAFPNLQWCQSTYAGVDPLFRISLSATPSWTLTRFAGKFGPPISEWCIARIIGHERQFLQSVRDQQARNWAGGSITQHYRYLSDLTLVILGGAGDIGRCIGRAARVFGMRVVGFGQTPRRTVEDLDVYTTDLKTALSQADYIVSVLPSTPKTRGLLSNEALQDVKRDAVFLNVGRGDVITEESLVASLDDGLLSSAILDVFATEPLSKDSPLWGRDDVTVSPHVSGITRAQDVPDVVLENYRRFCDGQELLHQVDWTQGY